MTAAETAAAATAGPVRAALVILLTVVGSFFLLVGTIGLLRFPNVYNRMHATSKATTLGAASIALAATVYYLPNGDGLMALVTVLFLFLTAPTGAHMISQAAQRMGVPFLDGVTWPRQDAAPGDADGADAANAANGDD
ncbi:MULTISPECIES: monovalent cation/H(+) antiporter subunit G [Haloferax]|uniref:Na(+)/H(+) antiporter subunit G n=1 Tax=Haloferax massiliensis TaxID=1476858 RepID=A0A0D6JRE6_9EURY|nr:MULTISPECIES: monovalent cation/H(+) antiporter subunit G [Haloferax]MDS0240334.1 monovalent cation/H(+) antiporter subunit G [Haloferax sp. S2CR25]MDS0443455.1 monovalent cation/H(+) antiporter subunit G [Haloferax sp. S2CR25-2]CQR50452.1 Na(+)/H(+) antiporter subunit G [Haloferax massiliensis]